MKPEPPTLQPGDWVADYPTMLRDLCYEVRGVEGSYVRLRALHVVSKQRFNCSSDISSLVLIRRASPKNTTTVVEEAK